MIKRVTQTVTKVYVAKSPYVHVLTHYAFPVVLLSIVLGSFLDKYVNGHPYITLGLFGAALIFTVSALVVCMCRSYKTDVEPADTNTQSVSKP